MKAIKRDNVVALVMSGEQASALMEVVQAEERRRHNEFKESEVMQCWQCYLVLGLTLKALKSAGIGANCEVLRDSNHELDMNVTLGTGIVVSIEEA